MFEQGEAAPGGYPGTAQSKALSTGNNYATEVVRGQPVRLPPYAKNLRPRADQTLFVVCGSRGWNLFDKRGVTDGILLPTPDPAAYHWPSLAGWADGLLIDTDGTLTSDQTKAIAVALLAAGLPRVIADRTTFARRPS